MKNTDNEFFITVRNKQTIDDKTDTIEETAPCRYYEKNGKRYILYKIGADEDEISSIIKIDGDTVSIKRTGAVNSVMAYKIGEKRAFTYEIPYGTIEMEIETHRIWTCLDADGGTIELVYTLTMQGEQYFNNMLITVTKKRS